MRKTLRNILAAAIIGYAAIVGVSCQKEDDWKGDPIQVDLKSNIDTAVFRGERIRIPFHIKSSKDVTVSLDRTENLDATLSYDPASHSGEAVLTLPFGKDNGSTFISIRNGVPVEGKNIYVHITPRERVISLPDFDGVIPPEGGDVEVRIETNLPSERIDFRYPEWMSAEIKDRKVILSTGKNLSFERNSGILVISDKMSEASECRIEIIQEWIGHDKTGEGYVTFHDKALLGGLIETWDKDGDRALSTEEAEAVTEIILPGRGIRDITGIGQLKRLEKIDLRDNMIEDATELRELYYLHWLDLKGNMSLRTFDVTGCCVYFDHCDYELTEDLLYHTNSSQIGVSGAGSPDNFKLFDVYGPNYTPGAPTHSHHVVDDYPTTDWSEHDRMIKIRDRKRQPVVNGVPKEIAFVIIGYGFIDRDIKDGSYERMAREFDRVVRENYGEVWDMVDVYLLTHLYPSRMHYDTPYYEGQEYLSKVEAQAKDKYNTEVMVYNTLYGKDNTGNRCVLFGEIGLHKWVWTNMYQNVTMANYGNSRYNYGLKGPLQDIDYDDPDVVLWIINGEFLDYGYKCADFLRAPINNADPVRNPGKESIYHSKIAKLEDFFIPSKDIPIAVPPLIEENLGLPAWIYPEEDKSRE